MTSPHALINLTLTGKSLHAVIISIKITATFTFCCKAKQDEKHIALYHHG